MVNKYFNRLVEIIVRFIDLYLSEYCSKFAIEFNDANMSNYDFAENFICYASQNSIEFEGKWSHTGYLL